MAEGPALRRPRRVKKVRLHPMRQRRACLGELIQIDGSPHRWFEGRAPACTLLVFIDDATGRLMTLLFVPSETTFAYFEATRHYLLQHGKPIAFYSDRHSIFRVNTRNALSGTGLTQFGRVARDLGIEIICANTPQAKGRVERANQTLQDRLVKEMRLRGISSMEEGNAFVQEFMDDFNARFAVTPRSAHNAHEPLLPSEHLEHIFTLQESRTLSKNLSLQYQNVVYQIQTDRPTYALRYAKVTVCEDQQGNIRVLYKGKPLNFSVFHRQEKQGEIIPSKLVDAKLQRYIPHTTARQIPTPGETMATSTKEPKGDISTLQNRGTFLLWVDKRTTLARNKRPNGLRQVLSRHVLKPQIDASGIGAIIATMCRSC